MLSLTRKDSNLDVKFECPFQVHFIISSNIFCFHLYLQINNYET